MITPHQHRPLFGENGRSGKSLLPPERFTSHSVTWEASDSFLRSSGRVADLSAQVAMPGIMAKSLQERYAPKSVCFGCGPANPDGLHIRSVVHGGEVVADWEARECHHAFDEILNGGIITTLLDCHSNWTAAEFLMRELGMKHPPPTVTSELQVKFLRPTPIGLVHLSARGVERHEARAVVEAELAARGRPTATFRGTFVAVSKGHPAYQRWR